MDLIVAAIVAGIVTIFSILIAFLTLTKKSKWQKLAFIFGCLLVGIVTGILIAPFIISFM